MALFDPFGVRVLGPIMRYFSSAQMDAELPPFCGLLLANRLRWSGVALAMSGATLMLFKPQRAGTGRRLFGTSPMLAADAMPVLAQGMQAVRRTVPSFGASAAAVQTWALLRFDVRSAMKSVTFLMMLLLAVANFIANHTIGDMCIDSAPYPLTRLMLEDLAGSMNAVLLLVLLFYSGELAHCDRLLKIANVTDATALPGWCPC